MDMKNITRLESFSPPRDIFSLCIDVIIRCFDSVAIKIHDCFSNDESYLNSVDVLLLNAKRFAKSRFKHAAEANGAADFQQDFLSRHETFAQPTFVLAGVVVVLVLDGLHSFHEFSELSAVLNTYMTKTNVKLIVTRT